MDNVTLKRGQVAVPVTSEQRAEVDAMCASGQARSWKDAWRSVLPEAYQEGWAVQYIYAGHAIIAPSRSKKHSTGGTK